MADNDRPSDEVLNKLPAVAVPQYHPVDFSLAVTSNEITVIGNSTQPLTEASGISSYSRVVPEVILKLSPQSAKDLVVYLNSAVRLYEKKYGPLKTDKMIEYDAKKQADKP
jgi:hypothetical protein